MDMFFKIVNIPMGINVALIKNKKRQANSFNFMYSYIHVDSVLMTMFITFIPF